MSNQCPKSKYKVLDKDDSLKTEKANAMVATRELLVGKPKEVVEGFYSRLRDAKTSSQISIILREVRELI